MKKEIRILMIEDFLADAVLIQDELRAGGFAFRVVRVESKNCFLQEIQEQPPDLILSDHGLPKFDGFTALAIAREQCPDIPFIFVTGAWGEDVAIQTFRSGATDYVLKRRLTKDLVPVVRRALEEAEERSKRKAAEAELAVLWSLLPICPSCKTPREDTAYLAKLEKFVNEHAKAKNWVCPKCADKPGA